MFRIIFKGRAIIPFFHLCIFASLRPYVKFFWIKECPQTGAKKYFFTLYICCLFFHSMVFGQDIDSVMREGQLYFEAGDYERADAQYRSVQDESLSPWQNQILTYDRGTVLLAQGRWEDSINIFQTIQIDDNAMPLMRQKLQSNMALARLRLAKSSLNAIKDKPNATLDHFINLFSEFREVFDDIEQAKASVCLLQKAEGAQMCTPSLDLDEMYLEARILYAELLHEFSNYSLSNVTLEQGASALWSGVAAIVDHTSFFQHKAMDGPLKSRYIDFFLMQAKSWEPLWHSLGAALKKVTPRDKEKDRLYQKSKESFFEAVKEMQNSAFEKSRQSAQQSRDDLDSFLKLAFKDASLKETAQHLLVNYTLAIERDPLQKIALQSLQNVQSLLFELLVNKNPNRVLKESYKKAQNSLNLAIQAFNNFKLLHARMYLEEARYFIKDLVQKLDVASNGEAESVLKNAIDSETLALTLNKLRRSLEQREEGGPDMDAILLSSQKRTVDIAEGFYPAVILEQTKGFRTDYKNQDGSARCQNSPWDSVVPLFTKGLAHAKQAEEVFSKNISRRKTVMFLQEVALREWQEALKQLKQKKKSKTKESPPAQADNKQEQPPKEPSKQQQPEPQQQQQQQPGGSSFNEVMILLQQMENEDGSKPQIMESSVRKDVERPW